MAAMTTTIASIPAHVMRSAVLVWLVADDVRRLARTGRVGATLTEGVAARCIAVRAAIAQCFESARLCAPAMYAFVCMHLARTVELDDAPTTLPTLLCISRDAGGGGRRYCHPGAAAEPTGAFAPRPAMVVEPRRRRRGGGVRFAASVAWRDRSVATSSVRERDDIEAAARVMVAAGRDALGCDRLGFFLQFIGGADNDAMSTAMFSAALPRAIVRALKPMLPGNGTVGDDDLMGTWLRAAAGETRADVQRADVWRRAVAATESRRLIALIGDAEAFATRLVRDYERHVDGSRSAASYLFAASPTHIVRYSLRCSAVGESANKDMLH